MSTSTDDKEYITLATKIVNEREAFLKENGIEDVMTIAEIAAQERIEYKKIKRIYGSTYACFENCDPSSDLRSHIKHELFENLYFQVECTEYFSDTQKKSCHNKLWVRDVIEFWEQRGFRCRNMGLYNYNVSVSVRVYLPPKKKE